MEETMIKNGFLDRITTVKKKEYTAKKKFTDNSDPENQLTGKSTFEIDGYIKVYNPNLLFNLFFDLKTSSAAKELFLYILFKMHDDKIVLSAKRLNEEISMGRSKYYSALKELIDMNLLMKFKTVEKGTSYWINYKYLFIGDRRKFLIENGKASDYINVTKKDD